MPSPTALSLLRTPRPSLAVLGQRFNILSKPSRTAARILPYAPTRPVPFSTQRALKSPNQQRPGSNTSGESQNNKGSKPPGLLDQLGASRGTKVAVITALCIFGTVETIFYVQAAWRYFYPPVKEGEEFKTWEKGQ